MLLLWNANVYINLETCFIKGDLIMNKPVLSTHFQSRKPSELFAGKTGVNSWNL